MREDDLRLIDYVGMRDVHTLKKDFKHIYLLTCLSFDAVHQKILQFEYSWMFRWPNSSFYFAV